MPLILLNRDPKVVPDPQVLPLNMYLADVVASALSLNDTPGGKLTADDIEVIVRDVRHDLDVGYVPLAINVFASDDPERRADLNDRRMVIESRVRSYLKSRAYGFPEAIIGNKKAFVWIFLGFASFGFL